MGDLWAGAGAGARPGGACPLLAGHREPRHHQGEVDPNTFNLDPNPEFWPNLEPDPDPDPDPGSWYQF